MNAENYSQWSTNSANIERWIKSFTTNSIENNVPFCPSSFDVTHMHMLCLQYYYHIIMLKFYAKVIWMCNHHLLLVADCIIQLSNQSYNMWQVRPSSTFQKWTRFKFSFKNPQKAYPIWYIGIQMWWMYRCIWIATSIKWPYEGSQSCKV